MGFDVETPAAGPARGSRTQTPGTPGGTRN